MLLNKLLKTSIVLLIVMALGTSAGLVLSHAGDTDKPVSQPTFIARTDSQAQAAGSAVLRGKNATQKDGNLGLQRLAGTWIRAEARDQDGRKAPAIKMGFDKNHLTITNESELREFDFDIEINIEGDRQVLALPANNQAMPFQSAAYRLERDKLILESGELAGWNLKGAYSRTKNSQ
jgi:hypothetical protein